MFKIEDEMLVFTMNPDYSDQASSTTIIPKYRLIATQQFTGNLLSLT